MVKGQKINESAVAEYLKDVDLIIAHNAKFGRSIFEITKIKSRIKIKKPLALRGVIEIYFHCISEPIGIIFFILFF